MDARTLVLQASAVLLTRGAEVETAAVHGVVAHHVGAMAKWVGVDEEEEVVHLVTPEAVADIIVKATAERERRAAPPLIVRPVWVDDRLVRVRVESLGHLVVATARAGRYASLNGAGPAAAHPSDLGTEMGAAPLKSVRQLIDSVNDMLKGQLDLELHGGHTFEGVAVRIAKRVLAMAAAIWHNHKTAGPGGFPLGELRQAVTGGGGEVCRRIAEEFVPAVQGRRGGRRGADRRGVDEAPSPVGQTQGGGQSVAETAAGGDGVGDRGAEGLFAAGAQRRGDIGPLQTDAAGRYRHRGSSQKSRGQ